MTDGGGSKDFFVSYTGADGAWAEWIGWVLEEAGYTVVLQAWDFRPGSNFVLEMQQAAAQAARTIAVFSPDFLASKFTAAGWATAFAKDPTGSLGLLLPVRVRECEPEGLLPQIVYIDLVGLEDRGAARDRLLAGIKRERAKPAGEPAFPASAIPTRRREIPEEPRFPAALQDEHEWEVESLQGDPRKGNMGMAQRPSAEWERLEEWLASGETIAPRDAEGVPREQPPRPLVRFTVFHPLELISEQWDTMLVYTHIPGGCMRMLRRDSKGVTARGTKEQNATSQRVPRLLSFQNSQDVNSIRQLIDSNGLRTCTVGSFV